MTELRLADIYDAGLFDLDGVVYRGKNRIEHAASSIAAAREAGMRPVFVTNNASRTPEIVAEQLRSLDIDAGPQDILGSAHVAIELAEAELGRGASVLLCGGEGLRRAAEASSLRIVESADDRPDGVIHGFSPETNWLMLSEAVLAINGGARYIATNLDRVIPRERGLMMGIGSMVKAVMHATGAKPVSGAKPDARMFIAAARKADASKALVLGDNLDTDILGATNSGVAAMHVLTGAYGVSQVLFAEPECRPRYMAKDLRSLIEPYPTIRIECAAESMTIAPADDRIDHSGVAEALAKAAGTSTIAEEGKQTTADAPKLELAAPIRVLVLDAGNHAEASAEFDGTEVRISGHDPIRLADAARQDSPEIGLDLAGYRALTHLMWVMADIWPHHRMAFEAALSSLNQEIA